MPRRTKKISPRGQTRAREPRPAGRKASKKKASKKKAAKKATRRKASTRKASRKATTRRSSGARPSATRPRKKAPTRKKKTATRKAPARKTPAQRKAAATRARQQAQREAQARLRAQEEAREARRRSQAARRGAETRRRNAAARAEAEAEARRIAARRPSAITEGAIERAGPERVAEALAEQGLEVLPHGPAITAAEILEAVRVGVRARGRRRQRRREARAHLQTTRADLEQQLRRALRSGSSAHTRQARDRLLRQQLREEGLVERGPPPDQLRLFKSFLKAIVNGFPAELVTIPLLQQNADGTLDADLRFEGVADDHQRFLPMIEDVFYDALGRHQGLADSWWFRINVLFETVEGEGDFFDTYTPFDTYLGEESVTTNVVARLFPRTPPPVPGKRAKAGEAHPPQVFEAAMNMITRVHAATDAHQAPMREVAAVVLWFYWSKDRPVY